MGGDEFCALLWPGELPPETLIAATEAALTDSGDGFEITTAYGVCTLPLEATDSSSALQLADRRLYAQKESRPAGVKHQLRGVLLEILGARLPTLADHLDGVAALALAVGRRMRLEPEAIDELVRAAEMHDVGKTAIPEAILDEARPARRGRVGVHASSHRSSASASSLPRPRSSRWRGSCARATSAGMATAIPTGSQAPTSPSARGSSSRVMLSTRSSPGAPTTRRAPSRRRSLSCASCAGTQFDEDVVAALCTVVEEAWERGGPLQDVSPTPVDAHIPG